jgi:hypothetical protein
LKLLSISNDEHYTLTSATVTNGVSGALEKTILIFNDTLGITMHCKMLFIDAVELLVTLYSHNKVLVYLYQIVEVTDDVLSCIFGHGPDIGLEVVLFLSLEKVESTSNSRNAQNHTSKRTPTFMSRSPLMLSANQPDSEFDILLVKNRIFQ